MSFPQVDPEQLYKKEEIVLISGLLMSELQLN